METLTINGVTFTNFGENNLINLLKHKSQLSPITEEVGDFLILPYGTIIPSVPRKIILPHRKIIPSASQTIIPNALLASRLYYIRISI